MSGDFDCKSNDRRRADRRRSRVSFVRRERRSGFDRRASLSGGAVVAGYDGLLRSLRDSPASLRVLLITANILNLADFVFTLNALSLGAGEANPVMRTLFDMDPMYAGIFKVLAIFAVTLLVWRLRCFRSALQVSILIVGVFAAIFFYHIVGMTFLF